MPHDAQPAEALALEALLQAARVWVRTESGAGPEEKSSRLGRPVHQSLCFFRRGPGWFAGDATWPFAYEHSLGMGYIHALLSARGTEVSAAGLAGADTGKPSLVKDDAVDRRARRSYLARLTKLEREMELAAPESDAFRAAAKEFDELREHLAKNTFRGRSHRLDGSTANVRRAVSRDIQKAIRTITQHDEPFGVLLGAHVKTGTFCMFVPIPGAYWELGEVQSR